MKKLKITVFLLCFLVSLSITAQVEKAPNRSEGEGLWDQLIIRGVTLVNGTLAPLVGSVDIVVEYNRTVSADFTSYTYQNQTLDQRNSCEIANASLLYQKESSAWSFKVEAQNVFDVQFKNQNTFTSYIISDSRTFILPRILLFSIGYNL